MSKQKKKSRVQGGWADNTTSPTTSPAKSRTSLHTFQHPQMSEMPPGQEPPNFSWVVDGVLAGSSLPQYHNHFYYYLHQGIRHIITLTEWKPPMHMAPPGLSNLYLPIQEFQAPSLEEMIRFVDYVDDAREKNEGVVAHCFWGRGRTGTMLACYLVKERNMDPRDAIDEIRLQRPYSVETYEQEDAVIEYAEYLKSKTDQAEIH